MQESIGTWGGDGSAHARRARTCGPRPPPSSGNFLAASSTRCPSRRRSHARTPPRSQVAPRRPVPPTESTRAARARARRASERHRRTRVGLICGLAPSARAAPFRGPRASPARCIHMRTVRQRGSIAVKRAAQARQVAPVRQLTSSAITGGVLRLKRCAPRLGAAARWAPSWRPRAALAALRDARRQDTGDINVRLSFSLLRLSHGRRHAAPRVAGVALP